MLHAAYDRLSAKDRTYVDGLMLDYYHHDLHDQQLLDTIASYQKSEPNDVTNEMHSVFGTEADNLPAPLEQYYKKFFDNRQKTVAYSTGYEQEFTSRKAAVAAYDQQLTELK